MDPPTPDIHTLSLHDALPISLPLHRVYAFHCSIRCIHITGSLQTNATRMVVCVAGRLQCSEAPVRSLRPDRKSTRLNSSHLGISYAVFCLKKKTMAHEHNAAH